MCGRYFITSPPAAIRALLGYPEQPNFPPRYNVAPTQPIPIVRLADGNRHFALMRWGLIPSWVKDPKTFSLLINARAESVIDKPAFRSAMRRRRCLIPADGFYEWKNIGSGKQPHFVRLKAGGPLAFAGLWETWTGPNGEEMDTAAIVTTRANRPLAALHPRMPVILPPEAFDLWLDCAHADAATAEALLVPARDDLLEAYEVSPAVNRVANDDARLIEPASGDTVANVAAREEASASKPQAKTAEKQSDQPSLPLLFSSHLRR
jgi:putative SOS response-associated peptidase YedK